MEGCTLLCEIRVNRIHTPVLVECVKAIRQKSSKREEVLLRAFLEIYQDMPLQIPTKELNDMDGGDSAGIGENYIGTNTVRSDSGATSGRTLVPQLEGLVSFECA